MEAIDTVKKGVEFSEKEFHHGLCHYCNSLICGGIEFKDDEAEWIEALMKEHHGNKT